MPTQRDMNSSIRWKRQAGELMGEKKNRERFSIKFNENDPAHDAVIRLLEKQGPHSKAQFLVNAVLHYINCREVPDVSLPQTVNRESIEKIVLEVLNQNVHPSQSKAADRGTEPMEKPISAGSAGKKNMEEMHKEMDENTLTLIADTMLAFRSS